MVMPGAGADPDLGHPQSRCGVFRRVDELLFLPGIKAIPAGARSVGMRHLPDGTIQ